MGRSETIHCIGIIPSGDKREELVYAMSYLEIYQKILIYEKLGTPIKYWYYQTKEGARILKLDHNDHINYIRETKDIKPPKGLIDCVCSNGCFICNHSKKTLKKIINKYKDWQINI